MRSGFALLNNGSERPAPSNRVKKHDQSAHSKVTTSIAAPLGRRKGVWTTQHDTLCLRTIVTMVAMGLIEQRFDHPILRREIPNGPRIARHMIAAADMADISMADRSGEWHGATLSPLPPNWRQSAPFWTKMRTHRLGSSDFLEIWGTSWVGPPSGHDISTTQKETTHDHSPFRG